MQTLISVQYLRAAAALAVVLYHYANVVRDDHAPGFATWLLGGAAGVDLFFVISGFIMWTISTARPQTPRGFLLRRAARIVPLYWAVTLVAAVVDTGGGVSIGPPQDWTSLIRAIAFVPEWNADFPHIVAPIVLVGWTLNLEMAFYVVFAALLPLPSRPRLAALCGVLLAMASARLVVGEPAGAALNLYTEPLVIEFAFGALLGAAYGNGLRRQIDDLPERGSAIIGLSTLSVGVVLLLTLGGEASRLGTRALTFGVPSLFILAGGLCLEPMLRKRPVPLAKLLGDASYSIYLVHLLPLAVIHRVVGPVLADRSPAMAVLAEAALAVAAGLVCYRLLERPLTIMAGRYVNQRRLALPPGKVRAAAH